jgi:hypothetical protein
MRYLKDYQLFLEDNFDIKDTDKEDVKMSKEKMNVVNKQISEYQTKKSQIADIYKKAKTIEEAQELIKPIIGDPKLGNPFLIKFNNISRIEKEVELLHDEIVKDKIRADDMRSEANLVEDSETKAAAMGKVTDIQNRIADKNKKILDKTKEFEELDKAHIKEIEVMKKDMNDYIKKISDSEQK